MAALITIHSPAEKRSSVNCNTLRDAQKRHKTPFRAAVLGFFVTYAALHSQKIPRGIFAVNSRAADSLTVRNFCCIENRFRI